MFKKYEKSIGSKCLLIMDKASSHISKEAIIFLEENNISYNLIPSGLTPILQPLDISVNKVFKDNIKNLFERDRLFLDNLNKNLKLKNARINLIDNIKKVWYDDNIITKSMIMNGFDKAGFVNIFYTSLEEDHINELYNADLYYLNNGEIIVGDELNIDINDPKNFINEDEDEDLEIDNISENNNFDKNMEFNSGNVFTDIKKEINSLGNQFNENLFNKIDKMDIDD